MKRPTRREKGDVVSLDEESTSPPLNTHPLHEYYHTKILDYKDISIVIKVVTGEYTVEAVWLLTLLPPWYKQAPYGNAPSVRLILN